MTLAGAADCERAAIRAYLLGADDESAKHWKEAARAALTDGDRAEAARYAATPTSVRLAHSRMVRR